MCCKTDLLGCDGLLIPEGRQTSREKTSTGKNSSCRKREKQNGMLVTQGTKQTQLRLIVPKAKKREMPLFSLPSSLSTGTYETTIFIMSN